MGKQAFFITGTDTSAGKTVVTAALIKHFQAGGLKVAGLKPIASGFDRVDGEFKNADIESIRSANNIDLDSTIINQYAYQSAIAPHIAAQQQGDQINLDLISNNAKQVLESLDVLLVEGVGGWLVPLQGANQPYQDIQDLALSLGFPVILVVGIRLGCINHALLTAHSIVNSGVEFAGWVANFCDSEMECVQENITMLDERMPVPRLFDMPFFDGDLSKAAIHSITT